MGEQRTALILLLIQFFILSTFSLPLVSAAEDSWITLEPMPSARSGLGVAVVDGKIYAIGGYNGSYLAVNEMYDPATDTWTTKKPMPTPRTSFGIAVYQNKIYLIGGLVYTNQNPPFYNSTNIVEVYDPETDTWITKKRMSNILHDYASTVVENEIYLLGGKVTVAGPWHNPITSNTNQIYDPENDTWTYRESMSTAVVSGVGASTIGLFASKRIYVIGGWNGDEIHGTNLTRIYDPENDEWSLGTPMSTHCYGMGVAVVNDELYVIGGTTGSGILGEEVTRLATNEKYTPDGYIPEFPSWIILPFFLAATLFAIVFRKRLFYQRS